MIHFSHRHIIKNYNNDDDILIYRLGYILRRSISALRVRKEKNAFLLYNLNASYRLSVELYRFNSYSNY